MFADSLLLFDILTKATISTKKSLMIDLFRVNRAYKNDDIDSVFFIYSEYNLADALKKAENVGATRCTQIRKNSSLNRARA